MSPSNSGAQYLTHTSKIPLPGLGRKGLGQGWGLLKPDLKVSATLTFASSPYTWSHLTPMEPVGMSPSARLSAAWLM